MSFECRQRRSNKKEYKLNHDLSNGLDNKEINTICQPDTMTQQRQYLILNYGRKLSYDYYEVLIK